MTYQWAQIGGPTVALNLADPVHPRFTAPSSTTNTALTFRLFVNDGRTTSNPDTVVITVLPSAVTNLTPTVNAGADQTLQSSTANLQGSVTDDGVPSPATVIVRWTAVSGPGLLFLGMPMLRIPRRVSPLLVSTYYARPLRIRRLPGLTT